MKLLVYPVLRPACLESSEGEGGTQQFHISYRGVMAPRTDALCDLGHINRYYVKPPNRTTSHS